MKQLLRNLFVLFALHLGVIASPATAQSTYLINHFAGGIGDGALATRAVLSYVDYIALDSAGNLYIGDGENFRVRKVAASSGLITTIAGTGVNDAYPKDGGSASSTAIGIPRGVAVDKAGNAYISLDGGVYRVAADTGILRRIAGGGKGNPTLGGSALTLRILPGAIALNSAGDLFIVSELQVFKLAIASGNLSLYAGDDYSDGVGNGRWTGDGGSALLASLNWPANIAFDTGDNLHIADTRNNVVRKVSAATGIITTVAGIGDRAATGLVDGTYSGDGGPAESAGINVPVGLAFDKSGRMYIGDSGNSRVRRVDTAGVITTFAGTGRVLDEADGRQASVTGIAGPRGVVVTDSGEVLLASKSRYCIRKVATTGIVSTVAGLCANHTNYAGDGGPGVTASMSKAERVAVDSKGNVFISDGLNGAIRRVDGSSGIITTIIGGLYGYGGTTPGDEGWLGTQIGVDPRGLATDSSGSLYFADQNRVRKWEATTGTVTTVAGDPVYGMTSGFSGDGGLSTKARFSNVGDIVVDRSGNLYISDNGNRRVRKLTATTGIVTTVAGNGSYGYSGDGGPATSASLGEVSGLAVDSKNNLFISNEVGVVRKVDAAGVITTVAGDYAKRDVYGTGNFGDGGMATAASFDTPKGIALDSADNLYIVDSFHQRIRRVDGVTAIISTVAGVGLKGNSGDGGLASLASLNYPVGIVVDKNNNIYVADTSNNSVRKVAMPQAVVAVPICTLTANPSVTSAGNSSTLTASCSPAATSYTWTGTGFGASASSGVVNPGKTTLYSVIGSNSGGSGLAASASVYVCNTPPSQTYPGLTLTGSAAAEQFASGIANDSIDGAAGVDTVIYNCNRSSFTITKTTSGWTVSSAAEGLDTLTNVERLRFGNETLALDVSGNAGQAYRIYQAAFNRVPDNGGLKFWIGAMDSGVSLGEVAAGFMGSAEFKGLYGTNPTNENFVTKLYTNILHRTPDAGGYAYWVNALNTKVITQAEALVFLSESTENQAGVLNAIINGIDLLN